MTWVFRGHNLGLSDTRPITVVSTITFFVGCAGLAWTILRSRQLGPEDRPVAPAPEPAARRSSARSRLTPAIMQAVREVSLYTRVDCHLCDYAARMLARLAPALKFTVVKRDIDTDPAPQQRFTDVVPVVAVGDKVVAEAPVDEDALRAALVDAFGKA